MDSEGAGVMPQEKTLTPSYPDRKQNVESDTKRIRWDAVIRTLVALTMMALVIGMGTAWAQEAANTTGQTAAASGKLHFGLDQVFIFLFVTLGPLKLLGPFVTMTMGYPDDFKHKLAIQGTIYATIGALVAVFLGSNMMKSWGVSTGALLISAGIVLYLVALQAVMNQFSPAQAVPAPVSSPSGEKVMPDVSTLAFAPLAFPTIITPYGVAILITLVTLRDSAEYGLVGILGVLLVVLLLNVVAMLFAERLLKFPYVSTALGIFGAVLGILQVALGVQAIIAGIRMVGILPGG